MKGRGRWTIYTSSVIHFRIRVLRIFNPRRAYCSVTLHLTSRVFVRLTKDTTYLTGNEGQKFVAVFAETAPLQS